MCCVLFVHLNTGTRNYIHVSIWRLKSWVQAISIGVLTSSAIILTHWYTFRFLWSELTVLLRLYYEINSCGLSQIACFNINTLTQTTFQKDWPSVKKLQPSICVPKPMIKRGTSLYTKARVQILLWADAVQIWSCMKKICDQEHLLKDSETFTLWHQYPNLQIWWSVPPILVKIKV